MTGDPPSKFPGKNSWDSFKTIGGEDRNDRRKDNILSWICLVIILAVATIALVPLLFMIGLLVITGGRMLAVNPTRRINSDKISIFSDRQSVMLFIYALGVWWISKYLAQSVLVDYGAKISLLVRFALACLAYVPAVWHMKRQIERCERAEKAERQALQDAKRRRSEALLRWEDEGR